MENKLMDSYLCNAKKRLTLLIDDEKKKSYFREEDPVQRLLAQLREWRATNGSFRSNGSAITPLAEPLNTTFTFLPGEMIMKVDMQGYDDCTLNVNVEEREVHLQIMKEARLAEFGSVGFSVDGLKKIYHLPHPIIPSISSAIFEHGVLTLALPWQLLHTVRRSILRNS